MTGTGGRDVAELERRLGDPWQEGNPCGHAAVLAADERAETPEAGERALAAYGLGAEFVPIAHGGRLGRVERLIDVLRAVYRRDAALGLGASGSLIAAVNVWTAGDARQRRTVADLLLGGDRLAVAYHELAHGNDLAGVELAAHPDGVGLTLNGRKEVIAGAERAAALVVFARTDAGAGSRRHSLVLVDKAAVAPGGIDYPHRFRTAGLCGLPLHAVDFHDVSVPSTAMLGEPGHGIATALRSFQVTRVALPAMALGMVDTGLRTALRFALDRRLRGRRVIDIEHPRAVLTDAFVDLLVCDCLCRVAARALHLAPGGACVYAAAAKYFVADRLAGTMRRLSHVLGAACYLREGPYGIFQKHARDLAPAGFGHIAKAACQTTILPWLPRLARRSWRAADAAPAELFRLDTDLPDLAFDALTVGSDGRDGLGSALPAWAETGVSGDVEGFATELRDLKDRCADLHPRDLAMTADPAAYDLVSRYIAVLAASACVGVREHAADGGDPGFSGDPTWLAAALHRLAAPPGTDPPPLPEHLRRRLFAELLARYEQPRSFDLAKRPIPG